MRALHRVFVYGTLKCNEPNHFLITNKENGQAKFIGAAKTAEKYPLIIASRFNIPFLLAAEGKGEFVEGEVYEVDDKMLSKLDELEDHPDVYERKEKDVTLCETSEKNNVWIYCLHNFKPELLNLPFLLSYESKGDHGLTYTERYLRQNTASSPYWMEVKCK